MMMKKKEHEEKWNKEKDKNTKLEREGEKDTGSLGVSWTFNKAHAKLFARCLRFNCVVSRA